MASVRFGKRRIGVPKSRMARRGVGAALVVGGTAGILPLLGFWMIPAGLMVLSVDSKRVRRFNRRATVWTIRKWRSRSGGGSSAAEGSA